VLAAPLTSRAYGFFDFLVFITEFAACTKPPSRDNHR